MIKYQLLKKENNSPITLDNFEDINKIIKGIFPDMVVDINKMGRTIREAYGLNGNSFQIYYGLKETQIFIPSDYKSSIKNKLESTGLKCL